MEIKFDAPFLCDDARLLMFEIDADIERLKSRLSNFEFYQQQFDALRTDKRKREFLAARIACNNLANAELEVNYDANNKPFLQNSSHKISISHAKNIICVAMHARHDVGVDIEFATPRMLSLQNRFCNANELAKYANNAKALLSIWCAKEALYKVIGSEAVDFSKQLEIVDINDDTGTIEAIHLVQNKKYTLRFAHGEGLCVVLVAQPPSPLKGE
jgi:4'-phosphopantetheinyl transferase